MTLFEKIKLYLTKYLWRGKRAAYKKALKVDVSPASVMNPLLKWPRNFLCVCGSGIKFKKCCLNGLARLVTIKDALNIEQKLAKHRV